MARRISILFVEDDRASVELMIHALREAGFRPDWIRVDNRRDFETGLRGEPDVIISDYYMPDFYGIDVLYMKHSQGLDVPVIVVSASLPEGSEDQLIRLGAADYVRKDQLGRLGKAVYDAMEAPRTRSEKDRAVDAPAEARGLVRGAPLASPH